MQISTINPISPINHLKKSSRSRNGRFLTHSINVPYGLVVAVESFGSEGVSLNEMGMLK